MEELREHFLQQEKVEPPIGQSAYMLPAKSEEFAAAVERRIFRGSIQADRLNLQGAEMLRPRRHRYMSQERAQTPDVSVLPPEALRRSGRHRPTVEPNISRQTLGVSGGPPQLSACSREGGRFVGAGKAVQTCERRVVCICFRLVLVRGSCRWVASVRRTVVGAQERAISNMRPAGGVQS